MSKEKITRRKFMRDAAVGTVGVAVGLGSTKCAGAESSGKDEKKILNYNPEMEYRRLGKTELMVSAVCLGKQEAVGPYICVESVETVRGSQ